MPDNNSFSEKTISHDPFDQFGKWYSEHLNAGIEIPDAVTLATSANDGRVSARTVLMKEYGPGGFIFYTNYTSRKGTQLSSNPYAALLFYWPESGRQVRVEGITEKLSVEASVQYFRIRPRESQIAACSSDQSAVIPDRSYLDARFESNSKKFAGKDVVKPEQWGGFRLIPDWFEFWQNGEFRLHDRLAYRKTDSSWIIERLAP